MESLDLFGKGFDVEEFIFEFEDSKGLGDADEALLLLAALFSEGGLLTLLNGEARCVADPGRVLSLSAEQVFLLARLVRAAAKVEEGG